MARVRLAAAVALASASAAVFASSPASSAAGLGGPSGPGGPTVRLSQLELEEVAAAQRAHRLAVSYEADVASAAYVQDEAAVARESVLSLRASYGHTQSLLRQEALVAYVGGINAVAVNAAGVGEYLSQAERSTYERVAVGDLSGTLTAFRLEQAGLSRAVRTYERDLAQDLRAERQVEASRRGALAQASALEGLVVRARSELAAEAAKHQASAGPPVGNGVLKAVATSMGLGANVAADPSNNRGPRSAALDATNRANGAGGLANQDGRGDVAAGSGGPAAATVHEGPQSTSTRASVVDARPNDAVGDAVSTSRQTSEQRNGAPTSASTTTAATAMPATATPATAATSTTKQPTTTATTSGTYGRTTSTPAPTTTTVATTTTEAPTTTGATTTTTTPATTTTRPTSASPSTAAQAPGAPAGSAASGASASSGASGAPSGRPPAGGVWLELRDCESGDNYQANTGNGFYGAYQFAWSTWTGLGLPGRPDLEPYWMQDEAAQRLQALQGWSPWPACSAALGL